MDRRRFVVASGTVGFGLLAGCLEGVGGPADEGPGVDGSPTPSPTPTPTPGEPALAWQVEPSATTIEYGTPYTVTVIVTNGGPATGRWRGDLVARGSTDATWIRLDGTDGEWSLAPGTDREEPFELRPLGTGVTEYGLTDELGYLIETWTLSVTPPERRFGDELGYYDGLGVTVGRPELTKSAAFEVYHLDEGHQGTREIAAGQGLHWAFVPLTTTNTNEGIPPLVIPSARKAYQLVFAGSLQQAYRSEIYHDEVSGLDELEFVHAGWEDGSYARPAELDVGETASGWLLYAVPESATPDGLTVVLDREDVRATWRAA